MSQHPLDAGSHWDHLVGPSRVPVGNLGGHFVEFFRTLEDQSTRISPSTLLEGEEAPFSQTLTMWWGHKPRCAPRHAATCIPGLLGAGGLELAPIVAPDRFRGEDTNGWNNTRF